MVNSQKILLVEDDENLAYLLKEHLLENGFEVSSCNRSSKALEKVKSLEVNLCLLDVMLPDNNGIDLAGDIRKMNEEMPIIFITARNLKSDQKLGYMAGCDDYVTKPFDMDLLVLKIKAVLSRYEQYPTSEKRHVEVGEYSIDIACRNLITPARKVRLSQTETGILALFFSEFNNPVTREEIMKSVWGNSDFFVSKSLDVYIVKLRKILKENTALKIDTIHAYGFVLTSAI